MPYTRLTSYQFERGRGFTEESVLAFRSLALAAIDELARSDRSATATFPLSNDEIQLVLNHRSTAVDITPSVVAEPMLSDQSHEVSAPLAPDLAQADEVPDQMDASVGTPPDDDFAAAARWLALATRNETEPYQPSLVRHHDGI